MRLPSLHAQVSLSTDRLYNIQKYYGVIYDCSALGRRFNVQEFKEIINQVNDLLRKQLKDEQVQIQGVKIVRDFLDDNEAELRRTRDGQIVLFMGPRAFGNMDEFLRELRGLPPLTEVEQRHQEIQQSREETLTSVLEGTDEFSEEDRENNWAGKVATAQANFVKGINNVISGIKPKEPLHITNYHLTFKEVFPFEPVNPTAVASSDVQNAAFGLLLQGDNLFIAQQLDQAYEKYSQAIWKDPRFADAYDRRGLVLLERGRFDDALKDFNKALNIDKDNAYILKNRGDVYFFKSDYIQALNDYEQAIALMPDFAEAHFNRGCVFDAQEDYQKAIECYTKAISMDQNYAEAYSNRGFAYYMLEDLDSALADFSHSIDVDDTILEAYSNRAFVYYYLGELQKSWEDVLKCVEENFPVDPQFIAVLKQKLGLN